MWKSSFPPTNSSQESSVSLNITGIRMAVALVIVIFFCFLAYFMTMMLNIYFTSSQIQENARYVLFVHLLISDSLFIMFGVFLLVASIHYLSIPGPVCYILVMMGMVTFKTSPYNLATMALERYVAICFPLHHCMLCSTKRAKIAILVTWMLAFFPHICEIVVLPSLSKKLSALHIMCTQTNVTVHPFQNLIQLLNLVLGFAGVGLIILITYVQIVIVTHKISSQSSLTSKGSRTIILHAFQLCLCMASLLSAYEYKYPYNILNFFIFTCLPRFLSPLIYGLRDEVLRKYIKQTVLKNIHFLKIPVGGK
ncbi:odorant receptor 131-2-like [Hyperolius riggenbachi]|uniref:odorant receptor 131-2-like n=1 Tax=Hyperolius riggenbachi TaxID=752182 RepID=UPI0035A3D2A4